MELILSRYETQRPSRQEAEAEGRLRDRRFLDAFREARARIYRPAMEAFGEQLRSKGHDYSIEEIDEYVGSDGRTRGAFIRLTLYPDGETRSFYGNHPGLIINADKAKRKVTLGASTMRPGGGGNAGMVGTELEPEALRAQQIEEHLIDLAEKVFV